MYIEENPLLPALLYPPREEENAHITLADTFQMALHQTSSFLTFCSSKPEGAVAADMTMVSLMSTGPLFFFFPFTEWSYLSQKRHFLCPSKQKHLFFLSLPLLVTHFCIKRNFCTTWLKFLCAKPNNENPRKKGE